jgi:hypothetical protein
MILLSIEEALKAGKVSFRYTKVNGNLRQAIGTTNNSLIPEEFRSVQEAEEDIHVGYVRYFDFDENGWRTFVKDNFISIVG